MLSTISFAVVTVTPIFFLIFIGVLLRKTSLIGKEFISSGSSIVYKIALPALVFSKMSGIEEIPEGMAEVVLLFAGVTLLLYVLLWVASIKLSRPMHGSFVQGAVRGNITIIGLAVMENAFGLETVQIGVVIIMVMMPLYNLLSIIVLGRSSAESGENPLKHLLVNLFKNPLIWAVAAGLPFGLFRISMPEVITQTLGYLSQLAMPLALICIGGSLTFSGLVKRKLLWITASASKLIILPLTVWILSSAMGITGTVQAALVLASACPTAVSSYAMAEAMGADGELAGEIISASLLFSIGTITFWIVLLMQQG